MLLAVLPIKAQQVVEDNFQQLKVHYRTPDLKMNVVSVDDNQAYFSPSIDGFANGGEIGTPELPQLSSLIVVPFCKDMEISIENAVYDTIEFALDIMPMQPSRSKSDNSRRNIVINQQVYSTDNFCGQPLAQVDYIGIARDRNLAQLVFSPVQINPVTNTAIVCRSADITVRYIGVDEQATIDLFQRYYTPVYSVGTTLNTLLSPKYVSNATPIRMIVLAHSSLRCNKLEQFINWKRSQGIRVDVLYIDEMGYSAPSAIDALLAGYYNNATAADPAPAFLLIVGDIAQVPSHNSKLTSGERDHITDLYYVTWTTGDKVADCYQGRFSATDTNTLGNIIDKTLLYEQYAFADDSYLARAALVAGEDNAAHTESGWWSDNAWKYADPAMDYIAYYYVNADNGFNDVTYYKNDTSYAPDGVTISGYCSAPNASVMLRNLYNTGIGLINYSAHGDWNEWSTPSFKVNHVASMSNNGKPSFMIGNCCLTNKFDKPTCFGEALIRRGDTAGAVGYVGGSNYTYWTEDFYWAVGVRSNITHSLQPHYDAAHLGNYDRLFHTHDEDFANTQATAGQIILYGNMTVQNSTSSLKDYYWEIYHLMGDPSLMPWMGCAAEPYVSASQLGDGTLAVHTMPNAYVAIVNPADSNRVLAAAMANAAGEVNLTAPSAAGCRLAVTAQGYKPFSAPLGNLGISNLSPIACQLYPNPATDRCTVTCEGMQSLQLLNALGQTIRTEAVNGSSYDLDLRGMTPGVYMLRVATTQGIATSKVIVR